MLRLQEATLLFAKEKIFRLQQVIPAAAILGVDLPVILLPFKILLLQELLLQMQELIPLPQQQTDVQALQEQLQ